MNDLKFKSIIKMRKKQKRLIHIKFSKKNLFEVDSEEIMRLIKDQMT